MAKFSKAKKFIKKNTLAEKTCALDAFALQFNEFMHPPACAGSWEPEVKSLVLISKVSDRVN